MADCSGNREGGRLHLVSVRKKTATVLFPTPKPNVRFDRKAYPICPGPLDIEKPDAFRAHGLYLKPGERAVHTLYVVHHGTRESIEVFELNAGAAPPILTWVGCAPAPPKQVFNGVVALPDGGFAATSNSADIRQYLPATGWSLVPGSEGTAPNGLEISKDGQWLYIAGWAEEKLTRLSRGRTPIQKDVIKLGFRPDNVRLSLDGSVLFAAGHTDKDGRSIVEPREPLRETVQRGADRPEDAGIPPNLPASCHRRFRDVHDGHPDWERTLAGIAAWRPDRVSSDAQSRSVARVTCALTRIFDAVAHSAITVKYSWTASGPTMNGWFSPT